MTPNMIVHYAENMLRIFQNRLTFCTIAGMPKEQIEQVRIQRDKYKSIIEQAEKEN